MVYVWANILTPQMMPLLFMVICALQKHKEILNLILKSTPKKETELELTELFTLLKLVST